MSTTIGLQIFLRDGRSIDAVHDSDSILIGSGPSAVLRLDDPNVSSIHAVVKVSPDGHVTIIDLGSEAGTTVNGYAVSEPVTLKVGDQIGVGGARVVITQLGAPKAHVLADTDVTAPTTQRPQAKQPMPQLQQPMPQFPEPRTVAAPPAPQPPKHTPPKPQPVQHVQQVQHMSHAHHSEKKGHGPASMGPEQAGRHIIRKEDQVDASLLNKPLAQQYKLMD
jgi:predicted component of type VI protein secretion system